MIKLDFLILSVGRVATQAIWRYTSSHPEVFLPSFYNTDTLIKDKNYGDLEKIYLASGENQKKGIIIHSPESLKEIERFSYDKGIHMVRNPFDMSKSLYNQVVHRSYIFTDRVVHPGSFEKYIEKNLFDLELFKIGAHLYSKDLPLEIIDFSQMGDKEIDSTMESVFEFLEVSPIESKELFHVNQQDNTSALMRGISPPALGHSNGAIRLFMAYEGDEVFKNDGYQWIMSIDNPVKIFSDLGYPGSQQFQDKPINIYFLKNEIQQVNQKELEMLDSNLVKFIEISLSNWCKKISDLENIVEPQRIKKLTIEQADFLYESIKDDIGKLILKFPKLDKLWNENNDYSRYFQNPEDVKIDPGIFSKPLEEAIDYIDIIREKNPQLAISALSELEAENPESPEIMELMGLAQIDSGNLEEGMNYLEKSSQLLPEAVSPYIHMAKVLQREDNFEKALALLLKADELSCGKILGLKKIIGDIYFGMKNFQLAEEYYLNELDLSGFNLSIMESLKEIYLSKGEREKYLKTEEICEKYSK